MISFLEVIYFIILSVSIILFVAYIYTLIRKPSGFKYFSFAAVLFIINIFVGNKISDLIIIEIDSEINNSDKILFIDNDKNQILISKNSSELNICTSTQKHSEKENGNSLLILPKNINIILKEDSKTKNRFWVKYRKYYFSTITAVGYLQLKFK